MDINEAQKKFSDFYDAYVDKIYRFAYLRVNSQEIAQDITADAFTRFWEQCKTNYEGIENPRAFLYAIAKNLIIDYWRGKDKNNIITADISELTIADAKTDLVKTSQINSDIELVRRALSELKEDHQNAIIWRYLDGLEIQEIAQLLGKTEANTRVLLHRALKELKTKLA